MSGETEPERCATCGGELAPEDMHRLDEGGVRVCNGCWTNPLAVTHYTAEHVALWRKLSGKRESEGSDGR